MIRNYLITAFRYITRNKIQSVIQIASLCIGMAVTIQIGLYVEQELKVDKFNEKIDRIYRLEYEDLATIPSGIGHEIKENFPEVENVVRISAFDQLKSRNQMKTLTYFSEVDEKYEREVQLDTRYIECDSTIFDVFTLPFLQGDPKTALMDPYSVVVTETVARSIFGNNDPIGKGIKISPGYDSISHTITGVIRDPENFHIDFDILIPIVNYKTEKLSSFLSENALMIYLLLPDPHDKTRTEDNINAYFQDRMKNSGWYAEGAVFSMRPLKDIYFSSPLKLERGITRHGNLDLLRILLAVIGIILVMACINYINLTTARASLRAREVGVRKVVGSYKSSLMVQFLAESVLTSFVSFLLAITIVQVLLPSFNQMTGNELSLERLFQPQTILFMGACILLLGVLAGIYPAVYMIRFQPVDSLKGELKSGIRSALFRRLLLTLQFTISLILIIGVLTILRQLKYMKNADLGFDRELVVNINYDGLDSGKRKVFKESLLKNPHITKVASGNPPFNNNFRHDATISTEYNGIHVMGDWTMVDPDYFDLMGIKILEGENFSWNGRPHGLPRKGSLYSIIINETAVREFGLESPIGKILNMEMGARVQIIGVVKDFNFFSLHQKIEPTIYWYGTWLPGILVKILPSDVPETIKFIKKEYEILVPGKTFWYSFLDETYEQQYLSDELTAKIISNFAMVAILIACLGLFGLSTFMAARRTKEIGMRKTLGASVRSIFLLLSREFVLWITLSILIACPAAWFIMKSWLQDFSYRTNIPWWIFTMSILIAFAIAFLTVTWQSIKTARTNPVEALRSE